FIPSSISGSRSNNSPRTPNSSGSGCLVGTSRAVWWSRTSAGQPRPRLRLRQGAGGRLLPLDGSRRHRSFYGAALCFPFALDWRWLGGMQCEALIQVRGQIPEAQQALLERRQRGDVDLLPAGELHDRQADALEGPEQQLGTGPAGPPPRLPRVHPPQ